MPDHEPFNIASSDPFKVVATPAKFGGVDALAKRPLDLSGQPVPLTDHLVAIDTAASAAENRVPLPSAESEVAQGSDVTVPGSVSSAEYRVQMPSEEAMRETHVPLLPTGQQAREGEGPVLQTALDADHRERFDDPSRYLRTDAKVKLPPTAPLRRSQAVPTAPGGRAAGLILTPEDSAEMASDADASQAISGSASGASASASSRPGKPGPRVALAASTSPSASTGTPEQRRHAFNQRLTQILSDQQHISEELNEVEQAAQVTRAQIHDQAPDEPPSRE
jgi:hypothetical protein